MVKPIQAEMTIKYKKARVFPSLFLFDYAHILSMYISGPSFHLIPVRYIIVYLYLTMGV